MLVSLNWLKEFVDIRESAAEIAELLTMGGIEVEAVTRLGTGLDRVYTARIEEITLHPSAKHLSLARITLGDREETAVCGAPNIRVGQIVPYAAVGAVLPSGEELREREIKGVRSRGMLCSEKELDLGEDASGILVLEPDTKVGVLLTEALPVIDDYILDTSVTANRGDCLSILGAAREVAALTGRSWKTPPADPDEGPVHISRKAGLDVPDFELCPRYVARMVEGVTIGTSPFQVRLKLHRAGLRPISNVVDATNLILLECGQPLHAFDFALLEEERIVVRRCDPGEIFVTLDNVERKLPENALTIRDGRKSVALAGIMGGLNSEIRDDTNCVLIESACFERFGIRRTSKALGLSTEASFRFERGVDPEGTMWAANRAAYLINELAGGTVLAGYLDAYLQPIARPAVQVRTARVNRLLGTNLGTGEVRSCLERLGITVEDNGDGALRAKAPSWRWDLDREEDMAEEVARMYGFENIPVTTPSYRSAADHTRILHNRVNRAATLMTAAGFTEVITMAFVGKTEAREFVVDEVDAGELALLNPLSEDFSVMRRSLVNGLLAVMKRNANFRYEDLKLFEIGRTFTPVAGQELPREDLKLAGLGTGTRYPRLWHFAGFGGDSAQMDFYDMKGALESLFEGLGVPEPEYVPSGIAFLHPGKSADIVLGDRRIGYVGELAPGKMREHQLQSRVQLFEILLEPLFVHSRKETVFKPLPRYPYVERDLSVIVEEKVSGDTIKRLISRSGHDIITSVILFDLFRGESIREGHKSMAFRIRYQSEERTLTDEEVQEVHSRVVETLIREVGATLRE